jgi:hypothetical protein
MPDGVVLDWEVFWLALIFLLVWGGMKKGMHLEFRTDLVWFSHSY